MVVIVMGVSGAGKTTVGAALAAKLGWAFLDADDFHPPANVAKMAAGHPLTDADREPWLERLNRELRDFEAAGRDTVLACSALKEAYRSKLTHGLARSRLVYLRGSLEAIGARVQARKHKYMPASLLASQFKTLEPPQGALEVDAALCVEDAVEKIAAGLPTKDRARRP